MRFVLVSLLTAIVGADEACEQTEQVSMLQTKDRATLSKEPVDLIQAVNIAAESLTPDVQVQSFLDEVKLAAKGMSEANGKEILLQRASQSEKMKNLIAKFQALSKEDQETLTANGGNVFEKLPGAQKTALVQQVSRALDDSVVEKASTRTYQNNANDGSVKGKCTETRDPQTGYLHRHCHGDKGTETTSRAKTGGHYHHHKYTHNGEGGNVRTETQSVGGGHSHTHGHSHVNGNTATGTTSSGGGNSHSHTHVHIPGVSTATATGHNGKTEHSHHAKGL